MRGCYTHKYYAQRHFVKLSAKISEGRDISGEAKYDQSRGPEDMTRAVQG